MSTNAPVPELLTVEEVARRLRVSSKSVYRYVAAGLPAIRLNASGPLRFDAAELEAWLNQNRAPGGSVDPAERATAGQAGAAPPPLSPHLSEEGRTA